MRSCKYGAALRRYAEGYVLVFFMRFGETASDNKSFIYLGNLSSWYGIQSKLNKCLLSANGC